VSALKRRLLRVADLVLAPFVYPAARLLRKVRAAGVENLPLSRSVLLALGVFPIQDHYYEPQFDMRQTRRPLSDERPLPGVDWNVPEQRALLRSMLLADELADLPLDKPEQPGFYINNGSFESGDAEFWYQLLRLKKPRRIFEIGGGNSTLLAMQAIRRNQLDDLAYTCKHVCIEPYESPSLEQGAVSVVRRRVEELDVGFFAELEAGDVLFIDSSHVIRPDGDVLFEYLELLPTLRTGVIVHVHDVFSPRNYPKQWLMEKVLFWNEQYLLEAFLTHNRSFAIIGSLNYLKHHHFESLKAVAPSLTADREPGSFYLEKRG
jgi:hypothetical protein